MSGGDQRRTIVTLLETSVLALPGEQGTDPMDNHILQGGKTALYFWEQDKRERGS